MTFSDAPEKLIDFGLHCMVSTILCYLLLGRLVFWAFAFQWLPDLVVFVLIAMMLVTFRYIPSMEKYKRLTYIHKVMHDYRLALFIVIFGIALGTDLIMFLSLQWGSHRLIDQFTHRKDWLTT